MNSLFFLPPAVEILFQSMKPLGRGESKGLEYNVQFSMLKRLRGRDRGEKTQRRRHRGEIEEKRQRGESDGKRQGEETEEISYFYSSVLAALL
jgi:hypothetical protein